MNDVDSKRFRYSLVNLLLMVLPLALGFGMLANGCTKFWQLAIALALIYAVTFVVFWIREGRRGMFRALTSALVGGFLFMLTVYAWALILQIDLWRTYGW